ncbi:signal peptide peptidase SppA [Thermococcus sp.]|uniref:signal peptide peptidase SppA n=1 Tax=Thermococcus sp. TaxID=35749 RepID=UPI002621774C|nr:signal peptide peptidase SppA [Thermococcus sp.]
MKNDVWKYLSFMLALVLSVFVMSTALLYLQVQTPVYQPCNGTHFVITVNSTNDTFLKARVAELEAAIRAVEMERKRVNASNTTIAVVPIFGIIDEETALSVVPTLEKVAKDGSIGGVLLWIESPGGDVGAVRDIYNEVVTLKALKPVVAYTGGLAASGGYYIAVGSDEIVADPLAEVGSIGVLYVHYNYAKNYAMNGINVTVFKTGKHKDMGAEWRALTPDERQIISNMINTYFNAFLQAVSMGRNMTVNETRKYANGLTWFAVNVNGTLVDRTGNFKTALAELERLMGVRSAEIKVLQSPVSSYSIGTFGYMYLDPRYLGR